MSDIILLILSILYLVLPTVGLVVHILDGQLVIMHDKVLIFNIHSSYNVRRR